MTEDEAQRTILGIPRDREELLWVIPALLNLLWRFDVAPDGPLGWALTILMTLSFATYVVIRVTRWRRRRRAKALRAPSLPVHDRV